MSNTIKVIISIVIVFYSVASVTWQIRNPTANEIQTLFHIKSVLTFSKEDKFQ